MKKKCSILFVLLFILFLTACGSSDEPDSNQNSNAEGANTEEKSDKAEVAIGFPEKEESNDKNETEPSEDGKAEDVVYETPEAVMEAVIAAIDNGEMHNALPLYTDEMLDEREQVIEMMGEDTVRTLLAETLQPVEGVTLDVFEKEEKEDGVVRFNYKYVENGDASETVYFEVVESDGWKLSNHGTSVSF